MKRKPEASRLWFFLLSLPHPHCLTLSTECLCPVSVSCVYWSPVPPLTPHRSYDTILMTNENN
jgi:hypothetical protein